MYLLDTNVVSELRKAKTKVVDPGVIRWAAGLAAASMYLSVVTLLELETGVRLLERRDHRQGALLREWLSVQVLDGFTDRILPIDVPVVLRCAVYHVPNPRPYRDALIAATAEVHGLTLVTRNVRDFADLGVPLFNPWEGQIG